MANSLTNNSSDFIDIRGTLYDGKTSSAQMSVCRFYLNGRFLIQLESGDFEPVFAANQNHETKLEPLVFQDIDVTPPLGSMPRELRFPNDAVFETADHQSLNTLLNHFKANRGGIIHALESNLKMILLAVVVVLAFSFYGVRYGVPYISEVIATNLPDTIYDYMDDNLMEQFDSFMLKPTKVSVERQQALQQQFKLIFARYPNIPLKAHFRSYRQEQPNAFALPSGDMVFLDELIKLAEHDEEVIAVLCHEIGHVYYRHSIQKTIQSSLVYWVLLMMTGDITAGTDLLVSLPAIMAGLSYSRDMETEADTFALALMQELDIDPIHFANVLERMVNYSNINNDNLELETNDIEQPNSESQTQQPNEEQQDKSWLLELFEKYISTHPEPQKRIERFREASQNQKTE